MAKLDGRGGGTGSRGRVRGSRPYMSQRGITTRTAANPAAASRLTTTHRAIVYRGARINSARRKARSSDWRAFKRGSSSVW